MKPITISFFPLQKQQSLRKESYIGLLEVYLDHQTKCGLTINVASVFSLTSSKVTPS